MIIGIGLAGISSVFGQTSIPISAEIPFLSPEMEVVLKKLTQPNQQPAQGSTVDVMSFGQLIHLLPDSGKEAGHWFTTTYFCAWIWSNSYGHPYEIKSTCLGLNGPGGSFPHCFKLAPVYSPDDMFDGKHAQGAKPSGATLPYPDGTSAIGNDVLIYRSEPLRGTSRVIQAYYSIPTYAQSQSQTPPFPEWEPIPLDFTAGEYIGVVTITLAQI